MSNYLTPQKMFNVGFLPPNSANVRIKQGLMPQEISNDCLYTHESYSYGYLPKECNIKNMQPAKQVQMSYDLPKISDDCPCARYVRAP
jgi:hypothetical protein